jgi:hypothetical protein
MSASRNAAKAGAETRVRAAPEAARVRAAREAARVRTAREAARVRTAEPARRRGRERECGGRKRAAADGDGGRQNESESTHRDKLLCDNRNAAARGQDFVLIDHAKSPVICAGDSDDYDGHLIRNDDLVNYDPWYMLSDPCE